VAETVQDQAGRASGPATRADKGQGAAFLTDLWYFALPGRALKPGRMVHKVLLGEPVLIGRDRAGRPFALRDICPHRGIPLSEGRFDGTEVECAYHGWRFDTGGTCTAIPSVVEEQDFQVGRITVRRYPTREVQGNVWIWFGDPGADAERIGEPPVMPEIGEASGKLVESQRFPCAVDHAVIGLMDPAHGPFVHRSWWWRSRKSIHKKAKTFAASDLGFTMVRHAPSKNSAAYKILGGEITTEISFRLPGVRVEHIKAGRHTVVGLTAVTPVTETETEVTQTIYWTNPWLTAARPLLRPFVQRFLDQDRQMVIKQQEGLAFDPALMLIDDADTQAKWYFRCKKEWQAARDEGRPFRNPVQGRTLFWYS